MDWDLRSINQSDQNIYHISLSSIIKFNFNFNLKTTSYTQKEGIIGGHKYAFRVRAKNHIGLSDYSEPLEILAEN